MKVLVYYYRTVVYYKYKRGDKMIKKLSAWSGALAVRITTEAKQLGWKESDEVNVEIKKEKIVIEKVK